MAIVFVGAWTAAQFNGTSGGTTAARTSTSGNLIAVADSSTDATTTISDSFTNTWSVAYGPASNGGDTITLSYVSNCTGGASHTVTITTNASQFSALCCAEYSGIAAASALDQAATGTGNSTSLLSASVNTTQADELILGSGTITAGADSTFTAGASFTIRAQVGAASVGTVLYIEDRIVASAGSYTSSATWGGTANVWICGVATFKGAAGGALTVDYRTLRPPGRSAPFGILRAWGGVPSSAVSGDISTTGLVVLGSVTSAAVSHDATVTAILPAAAAPYATASKETSLGGHLATAAVPLAITAHDVSLTAFLGVGTWLGAITTPAGDTSTTGLLVIGGCPAATVSHDAAPAAVLTIGGATYATVSKNAPIDARLWAASSLSAIHTRTASVVAILPVGVVQGADITRTTQVVVALLPIGVGLYRAAIFEALPDFTLSPDVTSGSPRIITSSTPQPAVTGGPPRILEGANQ